jgi:hypothetical protein
MINGGYGLVKMDVCDYTGNIVYQTSTDYNTIQTYDEDGNFIQTITNMNTGYTQCMDTDYDGGLYTIGYSGTTVYINHYTWDGSSYQYDSAGSTTSTELSIDPIYRYTFDCAVNYNERKLIIMNQGNYPWRGLAVCYDLSTGVPVYDWSLDQFLPEIIGAHGYSHWRHAVDIEIDHSAPCLEYCRIVVMERCQPWSAGTAFVKIDSDGNELDEYSFPSGYPLQQFYSIAINPNVEDEDGAYMTCNSDHFFGSTPDMFWTYEVPTGW